MKWNDTDGTIDVGMKGGNVTLQVGQEQLVRVVNRTGENLLESNYHVVRVDGAQGNRLKIALAQANNDDNSAETLGLVTENINNGSEGFVTVGGLVRQINTTGALFGELWNDGDTLYLSPTNAGHPTNIKPEAPNHLVIVGYVVRAHATQGSIFVKVDNGYELDELHNVKINTGSLSYGDLLMRSGSVWANSKALSGSYQLTGSLDISGSQTINGNQIVSGSLTITNNITVLGTSSFVYVTSSNLNLTGPYIYTNVFEPIERFGGLVVFDSGSLSHQATASLLWDSLNNHWIYQNASGSSYSGGMLLSGPRNSGSLGNEVGLTSTRIPKSVGGDHLDNSNIYDTGTVVKIISNSEITGSLKVTGGISGSIDFSYVQNVPSLVSGSSQINITGTTGYSTISGSIAAALSGSWIASDGSIFEDISFGETLTLQGGSNTSVSLLPGVNTFVIDSQHPSVSAAGSSNNSGRTYIQDILLDSFGHITGITTATETVVNTNNFTTGATFNTGDGIITFTKNDGNTYTVDIDGRFQPVGSYLTGYTETDTLQNVTDRGSVTTNTIEVEGLTSNGDIQLGPVSDNNVNYTVKSGGQIIVHSNDQGTADQYYSNLVLKAGDSDTQGVFNIGGSNVSTPNQGLWYTFGGSEYFRLSNDGTARFNAYSTNGFVKFINSNGTLGVDTNTYLTSTSLNGYATTGYVQTQITNLIDSSPATLDTLNELAAALGDDPNFATTVSTAIGNKVSKSGDTMTGNLSILKNNTTLTLGQINVSTGFTTIEMYAGAAGAFNGYLIRYNKDTSFDRLEFVDGGGLATIFFENGGFVNANQFRKIGGTSSQFLKADGSVDTNTYLTAHPSVSAAGSSNNSGRTYIQDILLDGFGHITGITTASETVTDTNDFISDVNFDGTNLNFTGSGGAFSSLVDISSVNTDTNYYVTGATFNTGNGVITLTRNDGNTVTVDIDGRFQLSGSYLTGYTETDTLATVTARGNTTNTSITVSGITSNNDVTISGGTLTVYESVSGATVFAVDGTNGRLFAVTDDLSNSLFSVNTISGLPVIEAFADYHIVMGRFNQNDFYLGTTGEIGMGLLPVSGYKLAVSGNVRATSFVKSGGTSSQFLKADGSVDSNTYLTSYLNYYTTGVTFNTGDGVLTFTRTDGGTYTVDLDGRYGSASTDYYTTGATFNTSNGVITYTRNDGGTYTVDIDGRFLTSYSETSTLEDVVQRGNTTTISITAASFITQGGNSGEFVKGDGSLDSNTYLTAHPSVSAASSSNNGGRTYIQDILLDSFGHITGITTASETVTDTNYYVTGATFNTGDGVITLTRNDGNTITVDIDGRFLTAHPSVSAASSSDNSGRTYIQDILLDSFGHITGITTGTETVVDTNTNYYVTGATFNTGNGIITMTRNDGGTVTVDIDGKYSELGHTHDDRYLPYSKTSDVNKASGWYTIAVNTGSRAVGKFILRDTSGGNHQSAVFYATHHYGNYSDITVLINSRYGGNPFRYIRIVDGSTYDGALLQVYIDDSSSQVQAWMLENIQASGWIIKDWIPDGTDPGDVTNFPALTETPAQVDLDSAGQGGMIVTGPIYGGGDTTQYEYLNTNNYSTTTDTRYYTETEIGNFFGGSSAITGYNKSNWDTAYGWGNHATQGYATTGYVQTQITNLIDGAPSALDTLNELAAALGDDANFATTIASSIGAKLPLSGGTMTGNIAFGASSGLGLTWGLNTDAAFIKFISTSNAAGGSYLEIGTEDDSNEEIKFTQSGNVRFYLATDGYLKNGAGYKYLYESGTWGIDISGNAATVTNGVYSNGSYSNPSWITALAGSKITGNISGNAYNITQYTINQDLGTSNSPTFDVVKASRFEASQSSTRNKLSLWGTSDQYAIGMESAVVYGGLNDYAMTFQFNNDADRGFWWGHAGHTTAQGAMALTTNGYLTVARGVRVGYGESDTATPNVPLQVYGSGSLVFDVQGSQGQLFSITDSLSGSLFSVNDISGLPILEVFSDDKLVAGSFGTNAFVVSGTTTTVSGSLAVSGSATVNGGTVWHSGNDGSGSGLDADTLDGYHASSFLTGHPSVSAAGSSNNSGRTYIQDILLDGFGHITGITTATETVTDTNDFISDVNFDGTNLTFTGSGGAFSSPVDISSVNTDTNYYVTGATFNTSTGVITMTRNDGGTVTVDIDGKYAESSHTHSIISDITDEHRLFNNMGQNHSSYTDFNGVGNFGVRYVNGSTNGPGTGSAQFYGFTLGLGDDYAFDNYALQLAIPRYNTSDRYITFRTREATTWGSWVKIYAGYSDTAGALTSMNISQFTNDSGYLTAHPSVSASSSSNNSGRTYIQDILLDSFGHITGITTATETVVDTDTNYYVTGATFNTSTGVITMTRNDGGTVTVDIDGKYQEAGTYLGAITYNDNSNANYQLLWGSGNAVYGTGDVYVNPSTDYVYAKSFNAGDWFRSNGDTGWYNSTYGGGIYQTESTMVKVYDNRGFYIDGGNTNTSSDGTLYVTATNNNDWLAIFNAYNSSKSEYGVYVRIAAGASYGYALMTDGSTWTYRVDGSGRVYAPIYYDINDTAYYLNPASTSNLGTVKLNSTASGTEVFTVDGVNGRLFTITDDLSNSLFSVNTIAGVPVIEAFADNKVIMGRYNQNDFHLDTNGNIAMGALPVSGVKLFVSGKLSIGGSNSSYDLYNNGTSYFNGAVTVDDNLTITAGYALYGAYGTWTGEGNKIQWHSNNLYFQNTGGGEFIFRNSVGTNVVTITNAGALTAASLAKSGGTSAQFLMADGSVSTNPGWISAHPSVSAASSVNNSGRTYIQDILLDGFGHITGITSATETVTDTNDFISDVNFDGTNLNFTGSGGAFNSNVDISSVNTDTNYYVTGATFNTSTGVITMTRNDGGTVTVDIDGKYAESSHTHDDRYFTETESDARFQPLENQRLSTSNSPTFVDIYANEWFRNNNSNEGLYNTTTTQHWSSQANGYWDASSTTSVSAIRFYTGGHVTSLRGHIYANSSNEIGFLNSAGNWGLRMDNSYNVQIYGALTVGSGTSSDIYMTDTDETTRRIHCNSGRIGFLNSSGTWSSWSDNTGNWHTDFAMYSPIYYDSNDTNYYLNPASTSNLKTVKVNSTVAGTEALTVDGVNGRLFTITDDMTDSIFSVNTISGLPVIEAFADYTVVMGRYGLNDLKIDNAGAVTIRGNTVWHAGNDGASSGLDADLLDGQHGSYYAAASSLSSYLPLGGGTMTGTITITNTDIRSNSTSNWTGDPGAQGKIQYHSNRWYIVSDSSSNRILQFRRDSVDVSYIDNNGVFVGNVSGNATTATEAQNATFLTQPNATWAGRVQLGGNGAGSGVNAIAVVQSTDGNLHMDNGLAKEMYLNYYHNGKIYLNGGTYFISANGSQYNGNASTATALTSMNISQFTNNSGYITAHPSVSAAGSSNNSGRTYIQDILLDGFGHITGITTASETVTDTNDFISDVNFDGTNLNFTGSGGAFNSNVDISSVNTDTNYYVTGATFSTSTGVITMTRNDGGTVTVDIDGKYAESSHTHDDRYFTETESDGRFQPLENQRVSTGNSPTFSQVFTTQIGINDSGIDCYVEIGDGNPTEDGIGYGGTFHFYGDKSVGASHLYFGGAYVTNNFVVGGRITENSSIRYKKDIETLEGGLDKVLAMRGVTYIKKDTGIKEVGLIAEELAEILPEVVGFDTQGQPDSVSYSRLTAILVEAIKDLKKEIDELKGKK
jgi:hypothetical protein